MRELSGEINGLIKNVRAKRGMRNKGKGRIDNMIAIESKLKDINEFMKEDKSWKDMVRLATDMHERCLLLQKKLKA